MSTLTHKVCQTIGKTSKNFLHQNNQIVVVRNKSAVIYNTFKDIDFRSLLLIELSQTRYIPSGIDSEVLMLTFVRSFLPTLNFGIYYVQKKKKN